MIKVWRRDNDLGLLGRRDWRSLQSGDELDESFCVECERCTASSKSVVGILEG
jgi:hypothetical protein